MLPNPDPGFRSARWPGRAGAALAGRARAVLVRVPVPAWIHGALFLLFALLYRVTATRDYTFDSVSYALQIERFLHTGEYSWLFHPHHVLFNPAGLLAFRILRAVGCQGGTLDALQWMNALLGAAGVSLFAWVAGWICRDRGAGLLAGAGLGFSYGYWTCATDGRVNIAGIVVLVGVLAAMAALLDPRCAGDTRGYLRWAAVLGMLHTLAVLLHQSHVLAAPAALLAILLSPSGWRWRGLLAYLCGTLGLGSISYLLAARLATGEAGIGGVVAFATTYAHQGQWWSLDVWGNLARDVDALVHALVAQATLSGTGPAWSGSALRVLLTTLSLAGVAAGGAWWVVRRLMGDADGESARRAPAGLGRGSCRAHFRQPFAWHRRRRRHPLWSEGGPAVGSEQRVSRPLGGTHRVSRPLRRILRRVVGSLAVVRRWPSPSGGAGERRWGAWWARLRARPLPYVLAVWMAAYAGFFTLWNPGYFVFWVPLLVPLWLLVARGLASRSEPLGGRPARWLGPAAALLVLAANNAAIGIAPHAHAEGNGRLQKALAVRDHTRPGDVILIAGVGDDADAEVYIPYFARRGVIPINTVLYRSSPGGGLAALRSEIGRALAAGRRVFVHEELLSSEGPYVALRSRHGLTRGMFIAFLHRHYRLGVPVHWRVQEVREKR